MVEKEQGGESHFIVREELYLTSLLFFPLQPSGELSPFLGVGMEAAKLSLDNNHSIPFSCI